MAASAETEAAWGALAALVRLKLPARSVACRLTCPQPCLKILPARVRSLSLYKPLPSFCVYAGSIGSYYSIGASLLQAVLQVMRFNKAQGLRLLYAVACV